MKQGDLSREQAVELVGNMAADAVERENCEPTNRVGYNGSCQGDDLCEWSAAVTCADREGDRCALVAYYYTTNEQDDSMAAQDGDGSAIDWQIDGYEVI